MIALDQLTKRRAELDEALRNARRTFDQIDGRIQEIDAMIDFCKNSSVPAQTGNDTYNVDLLDETTEKTVTTP